MKITHFSDIHPAQIEAVYTTTFSASEGADEGAVIGELVRGLLAGTDSADLQGFVLLADDQPIGCVLFSRLWFESGEEVFLLSPMAIHPDFQNQGLGQRLIRHALQTLETHGVELVVTYGDPAFYSKLAFKPVSESEIQPPYPLSQPMGWQACSLAGTGDLKLKGQARCVAAFQNPAIW